MIKQLMEKIMERLEGEKYKREQENLVFKSYPQIFFCGFFVSGIIKINLLLADYF